VVVQLAPDSGEKRRGNQVLASAKARRLLAKHGGEVIDVPDAGGAPGSATITVPDMARANALATALRELDEVETAYAKPEEELP